MKRVLALSLPLAACAAPATRPAVAPAAPYTSAGLERVIGATAAALVQQFGEPQADVREGDARKLQFGGAICVLDAYLYPRGQAEPRVTYLDSRQPDGSPIDRASCAAALLRKGGGR